MSYDWSVDDLTGFTETHVLECPRGDEGDWLYVLENAALEARLRIDAGHYSRPITEMVQLLNRLGQKTEAMRKVAALRGYFIGVPEKPMACRNANGAT